MGAHWVDPASPELNGEHLLARVYIVAGQPDKAIAVIDRLLRLPYDLTPAWLRIDPNFQPLKGHPDFERLAGGG